MPVRSLSTLSQNYFNSSSPCWETKTKEASIATDITNAIIKKITNYWSPHKIKYNIINMVKIYLPNIGSTLLSIYLIDMLHKSHKMWKEQQQHRRLSLQSRMQCWYLVLLKFISLGKWCQIELVPLQRLPK